MLLLDDASQPSGSTLVVFLIGIVLFFYVLGKLKKGAYNLGGKITSNTLENIDAKKDEREHTSTNEYARRAASPDLTPEQLRQRVSSKPSGFDEVVRTFQNTSGSGTLKIPMFQYAMGLPGPHLLRESRIKPWTLAKIIETDLVFFECPSSQYASNSKIGDEIGRVRVSSVQRITVIDFDRDRISNRARGKAIDAVFAAMVKAGKLHAAANALGMEPSLPTSTFTSAGIVIHYFDSKGILFQAFFAIPSGTGANKQTQSMLEKTLKVRGEFVALAKWDKLLTGSSYLDESPMLTLANSAFEKVDIARTITQFFSTEDPAVRTARATAEMLAMFTQNTGFVLDYVRERDVPAD